MYYAKQNKSVRERQIPCNFTHMEKLEEQMSKQMESRIRPINTENKLMAARGKKLTLTCVYLWMSLGTVPPSLPMKAVEGGNSQAQQPA